MTMPTDATLVDDELAEFLISPAHAQDGIELLIIELESALQWLNGNAENCRPDATWEQVGESLRGDVL